MSNYGQTNRQVVQDTNAGRVDPPVTEVQGSQSHGGARKNIDRTVGQEGQLASALVEVAGSAGQVAAKERLVECHVSGDGTAIGLGHTLSFIGALVNADRVQSANQGRGIVVIAEL